VAGAISVGVSGAAWALVGLKPQIVDLWVAVPQRLGLALVVLGLAASAVSQVALHELSR